MRIIKFRGLCKGVGWRFGELHRGNQHEPYVGGALVQEETIGQFVGYEDNKRNEIYEGDILKNKLTKELYLVVWNKAWAGFALKSKNRLDHFLADGAKELLTVIGNAHENKDLLLEV